MIMSGSTSMLEIKVDKNVLGNIEDLYKSLNPRLVAIKLDKLGPGLPYTFSNIKFLASRTPSFSAYYDFQYFLKAANAAETSFAADNPELIDFLSEKYQDAVQRLKDCLSQENLDSLARIAEKKDTLNENQLTCGIAVHLIKPLSGHASVNKSNRKEKCPCGCDAKVESGPMWIGAPQVWHGELDIISGNETTSITSVATSAMDQDNELQDVEDDLEDSEDESLGDDANFEVKNDVTKCNICQILSQGIVFGWTEFNRHKNYGPYIPSIMIDNRKYMFVLYNPQTDTLFTSEGFVQYYPFEDYFGLINLWVILNHRLFFIKHCIDDDTVQQCGFKTLMAEDLIKYQSLLGFKQSITVPSKIISNVDLQPRITLRNAAVKRPRMDI